jgi:hypothetical protein
MHFLVIDIGTSFKKSKIETMHLEENTLVNNGILEGFILPQYGIHKW